MNILSIALKEIKQDFRDIWTVLLMIAFPIVLMLILGLALSSAFNGNLKLGDLRVLVNDNSSDGQLSQSFTTFIKEMDQVGVKFSPLKDGMNGKKEVEQNRYIGYVELKDSGISFYGSSRSAIESNIVQGMVASFTDKYNAMTAVAQIEPAKLKLLYANGTGNDYVKETSIHADRVPGALDYYALAMTVMISMWGVMSAAGLIRVEVIRNTASRLMAAPVSKAEIFIGKVLGEIVINMLCIVVIVLFSKYVFQAYWGTHLGIVLMVLLSVVIMSISFGLAGGFLLKNTATNGIMLLIVQLASFFGGAYYPIGDISGGGMISFMIKLSPVRVANQALTQVIYGNELSAAWPVIRLNLTLAVLFLGVSTIMMRRREGL